MIRRIFLIVEVVFQLRYASPWSIFLLMETTVLGEVTLFPTKVKRSWTFDRTPHCNYLILLFFALRDLLKILNHELDYQLFYWNWICLYMLLVGFDEKVSLKSMGCVRCVVSRSWNSFRLESYWMKSTLETISICFKYSYREQMGLVFFCSSDMICHERRVYL